MGGSIYTVLQVKESSEIQALCTCEAELRETLHALSSNEYLARLVVAIHAHREAGYSRMDVFDRVVAGDHFQMDGGFLDNEENAEAMQRLGGLSLRERLECVPHLQRLGFDVQTFDEGAWSMRTGYRVMTVDWSGEKSTMAQQEQIAECGIAYHPASASALPVCKTRRPFRPRDNTTPLRFAVGDASVSPLCYESRGERADGALAAIDLLTQDKLQPPGAKLVDSAVRLEAIAMMTIVGGELAYERGERTSARRAGVGGSTESPAGSSSRATPPGDMMAAGAAAGNRLSRDQTHAFVARETIGHASMELRRTVSEHLTMSLRLDSVFFLSRRPRRHVACWALSGGCGLTYDGASGCLPPFFLL